MPLRSSTIKRRFGWADALAAAFVLALAGLVFALFYGGRGDAPTAAVISVDGAEVQRVALPVAGDEPLTIRPDGLPYPLTIQITGYEVMVLESACPSQDCVASGTVSRSGESIICLPNRLVVQLTGGSGSGIDAALG